MWENIKLLIRRLFGRITNKTDMEAKEHANDTARYEDTSDINIGAIVAGRLATLTVMESAPAIVGDSKRAEALQEITEAMWQQAQEITARAFGIGGCALVPYVAGGKIYTDIVPRDRFFITRCQGTDILACTVIADVIVRKNVRYIRLTDYELEGSTYVIRNRAVREESSVPLDILPEWAEIAEEVRIGGCDRLLLAYLKSPFTKGRTDNLYGTPIIRGSEKIIDDIKDCLTQIRNEFKYKGVKIFADETLFNKTDNVDASLYKKTMGGGMNAESFFEIFDPQIRESAYHARLETLFALLEKSIGTSRGILTDAQTVDATATAIRRANSDTYALVSAMRSQWANALRDLVYAYDVLCNAFNVSPAGEYEIAWHWNRSLIESSTERWQQLAEGKGYGAISTAELRRELYPDETLEDATAKVEEIKADEPPLSVMLGD